MAKSLVLSVLLEVLGQYVEAGSLSEENLRLGVLSGKLTLTDLRLGAHALRFATGLPVLVLRGQAGSVRVDIPWTALGSAPVRIAVDEVYLQCAPIDAAACALDLLVAIEQELKTAALKAAEDAAYAAGSQDESSKAGFLQQLVAKIVDNVELHFTNVHVTFEDALSTAGGSRGGLLLRSLVLQTCDPQWNPHFVTRPAGARMHKLGKVSDMGVYWLPRREARDQSWAAWLAEMRAPLAGSALPGLVLDPTNSLTLHLTVNERHDAETPKFDVTVSSSGFRLALTKTQLDQINASAKTLADFERVREIRQRRPSARPTASPREWWLYARWRVTGRSSSYENTAALTSIISAQRVKAAYVRAVKEMRVCPDRALPSYAQAAQLVAGLEAELPLAALVYFRQCAMKELTNEEAARRKAERGGSGKGATGGAAKGSIFGYIKRGFRPKQLRDPAAVAAEEQDEAALAALQEKLELGADLSVGYLARCELEGLSIALDLVDDARPFASVELLLSADLTSKSSGTRARLGLERVSVLDKVTVAAPLPLLLSGLSPQHPASLSVRYNSDGAHSSVDVRSAPLQLSWNQACVRLLVDYATPAPATAGPFGAMLHPIAQLEPRGDRLRKLLPLAQTLALTLEVDAPLVVFPLASPLPCFVVFDMGHLSASATSAGTRLSCSTGLTNVRAGVASSSASLLDIQAESIFLPFDMGLELSDDGLRPRVRVSMGDALTTLNYRKIALLLRTYECVLASFQPRLACASSPLPARTATSAPTEYSVSVGLASIGLELEYDGEGGKLVASASGLSLAADPLSLAVHLRSLAVTDAPHAAARLPILEGAGAGDASLVSVLYTQATSSCSANVGEIVVGLCESALVHVSPLAADVRQLLAQSPGESVPISTAGLTVPSSELRVQRVALHLYAQSDDALNIDFSLSLTGLFAEVRGERAKASLLSLDATDLRPGSASACVCRSSARLPADTPCALVDAVFAEADLRLTQRLSALDVFVDVESLTALAGRATALSAALALVLTGPSPSAAAEPVPPNLAETSERRVALEVRLVAPRLVFLRDKRSATSTALCTSADIALTYATTSLADSSTESLNVAIDKAESFLLADFSGGEVCSQIMYPFGVALEVRRALEQGRCMSVDATVSLEDVSVQARLTELMVMLDILRKRCTGAAAESKGVAATSPEPSAARVPKTVTQLSLRVDGASLDLLVFNDCLGPVHPVLRASMRTSAGLLAGSTVFAQGRCEVLVRASVYNDRLVRWEPLLEELTVLAGAKLEHDGARTATCNLLANDVQINVSSANLKTLNDVLTRVAHFSLDATIERHCLYFHNDLGEPIDLYDSASGALLLRLPVGAQLEMPLVPHATARAAHPGHVRAAFPARQRSTQVNHMPLSSSADATCYRVCEEAAETARHPDSEDAVAVDEVFENQRYSLQSLSWVHPFLVSDPAAWTDGLGAEAAGIRPPAPPLEGWEWTSPWEVALDGVGEHMDGHGFSYDINFRGFSCPRSRRALDSVRRRRWRRARRKIFVAAVRRAEFVYSSLAYCGASQVFRLSARVTVANRTSLSLGVWMSKFDDPKSLEYALQPAASVSVPLAFGVPDSIRFCVGRKGWSYVYSLAGGERAAHDVELLDADAQLRHVRLLVLGRADGRIEVQCLPPCTVENKLPFDLLCAVAAPAFSDTCVAGGRLDLHCADNRATLPLRLSFPGHASAPLDLAVVEAFALLPTERDPVCVCVASRLNSSGTLVVTVYSKAVVLNYCDISLQITTDSATHHIESADRCGDNLYRDPSLSVWASGSAGLRFLNMADSDDFSVGVEGGRSAALSVAALEATKFPFEVSTPAGTRQLAYSLASMAGVFSATKLVSVLPKFRLLNALPGSVYLRHSADAGVFELQTDSFSAWHPDKAKTATVSLKIDSSEWSVGMVDLNAVGSFDLLLPSLGGRPEVVHVEIGLAPPSDLSCCISVVFWKPSSVKVENTSGFPLLLIQSHKSIEHDPALRAACTVKVGGRASACVGWIDPSLGNLLKVAIDDDDPSSTHGTVVDMVEVGGCFSLEDKELHIELFLEVVNCKGGKVLRVSSAANSASPPDLAASRDSLSLHLGANSVGVSLIAELPSKREVLLLTLTQPQAEGWVRGGATTCSLRVRDVQADCFFDCNAYPVLLYSGHVTSDAGAMPAFEVFAEVEQVGTQSVYRSILMRLLEVTLRVDASAVQQFLVDFVEDTEPSVDSRKALNDEELRAWVVLARQGVFGDEASGTASEADVRRVLGAARQTDKMYIENMVIHPVKLTVSFTTTPLVRELRSTGALLSLVTAIGTVASVNELVVRIRSFIACNVLETRETLVTLLVTKIGRDIQGQLLHLAGSFFGKLDAIGRPADLFSHVGGGVQDFFYEPYQGLMKSPKDFAKGLGKGTTSLISGLVTGSVYSTMTILKTAAKGGAKSAALLSEIAGDKEQTEMREQARLKSQRGASRGVLGGLISGSTSLVTGISSGITGLVTKPMEGGKKGGAEGFFKGIGHGVIGVAVNPLVGVGDGIAAVAHGVSTQLSREVVLEQVRRARSMQRLSAATSGATRGLLLVPIDKDLVEAEAVVKKRAAKRGVEDRVLCTVLLGLQERMIVSAEFVSFHAPSKPDLTLPFSSMSHFKHRGRVFEFVCFSLEPSSLYTTSVFECKDDESAERVLEALLEEAAGRVQNPSAIPDYE